MATRFYLPSTGAAAVSPAYGSWADDPNSRLALVRTKISSAMTDQSASAGAGTCGARQYVSEPLAAQTISGTVKCYIRCRELDAGDNCTSRLLIRVCNNAGTAYTGTLLSLAHYGTSAEFNTSLRNIAFANGDTLSSLAINEGDRLVVELGNNNEGANETTRLNFGDNSGTDLGENETETTANNPWIEFSADLFSVVESRTNTDSVVLKDTFLTNIQEPLSVRTLGIPVSIADIFGTNIHSFPQSALADTTLSLADAAVTDIVKFVTLDVSDLLLLDADAVAISGVLWVNANPVQMLYRPRMLVLLTIAAQLERYSTEDIDA